MNYQVGDYIKCTNSGGFIFKISNIDLKKYEINCYVIESNRDYDDRFNIVFDCLEEMDKFPNGDYTIITNEKEINRLNKIMVFK